jgi:hypothetical protein
MEHNGINWNTTKSTELRVVNYFQGLKKNPAKSGVLLVRESTISGRLQLPVYLIGGGNQILLCPITSTPIFEHLVEPLRKRRGLSGKLWRAACGRIAQPSQNTV